MRVTPGNRDALARVAETELGGVSLDEALRILLPEHLSRVADVSGQSRCGCGRVVGRFAQRDCSVVSVRGTAEP